jgi:hypothetical protein
LDGGGRALFTLETQAGEPIIVEKTKIIPIAQVLRLQPPGYQGGLIWNRPTEVRVEQADGSYELLPIQDITRLVQIILAGLVAGVLIFSMFYRMIRSKE